jgi:hypothetical protein
VGCRSMSEYKVGTIVKNGAKEALITRIVNSVSFFEDHDTKKTYTMTELYLETLDAKGDISFISLSEAKEDVEKNPDVTIVGPDTLEWRKMLFAEVD